MAKRIINDMTIGSPMRHIINFSIPMLIGNIFQQLYNIVDAIVVGKFVGHNALAAVGASTPLFFFLFSLTIGLTTGTIDCNITVFWCQGL